MTEEYINKYFPEREVAFQNMHNIVPCSDPGDWEIRTLNIGCCTVRVAVHKTIQTAEMLARTESYYKILTAKALQEGKTCAAVACPEFATGTLRCVDDKPVIE